MKRVFLWLGLFLAGLTVGLVLALLVASRFLPRAATNAVPSTVLITISATIDGSERFVFTPDNVWNIHGQWSPPQKVFFNGEPWPDLSAPPPGWADLAGSLDLTGASIAVRKGRDVIALERTGDGFELIFADTQMGAASYEVTLSIPRK